MGLWPSLVVAALLCASAFCSPDWTDECPTACRCKWSSGKKTALCREAGFTTLPTSLNSDMQVLDLSGNAIPYLTKDAFRSVGLINLQRIFVRNARIREIHKDAFRDLLILVEVDLSENLITNLNPATFVGNVRLRVLYLSSNPLRELVAEQFSTLSHLRTLELEKCHLTVIHRDAFVHISGLESLNLKDNKLSELSEAVFGPIARLKTLVLDGNPWFCDCRLRGFRNWFLASKLHSISLTCSGPKPLHGLTWQNVPSERFACAPQVTLTERLVQVDLGGNVTIGCRVRGDPEPEVTWLYNGRVIGSVNTTRPDQVLLIEVEEGLLDKWINISVYNVSDLDAGDYSCVAKNIEGSVSRNVTLLLPPVAIVSTLSRADTSWWWWVYILCGASVACLIVIIGAVGVCCACGRNQRRRKRHRRKGKLKGSVSFTDQEKKLLDLSITTTTERQSAADSCEMLGSTGGDSQPDLDGMDASGPVELCEPPPPPVHITIESHTAQETSILRPSQSSQATYPATLGVYPPPPEFSTSILPVGAFGNILISVSVSQDPTMDIQRYPDLLDIPHRGSSSSKPTTSSKGVSVAAGPDVPFCLAAESYATLPRRPLRPLACSGPQYDNMGPRVTAGGSSTLSLPDVDPNLQMASIPEDIPPPPPPPICSPLAGEYVSL